MTEKINAFGAYLRENEKSTATVEKYQRDARAFAEFLGNRELSREFVLAYKQYIIEKGYAARSINSMIASVNAFLEFLGRPECRVKSLKLQRQVFCPEEKELTKAEYLRLVETAKKKGNGRLALLIQTICGTGIRVSELKFITVEAAKRGEKIKPTPIILTAGEVTLTCRFHCKPCEMSVHGKRSAPSTLSTIRQQKH